MTLISSKGHVSLIYNMHINWKNRQPIKTWQKLEQVLHTHTQNPSGQ